MSIHALTLPDATILSEAEVLAVLDCYARAWPAVFDLYDLSCGGPHDEVMPIDVLAPNALNAWGNGQPMTAMTGAWAERHRIAEVVRPISKQPLEQLSDAEVNAEADKVGTALDFIDSIRGYGDTTAPKFFHRLRPNLGPIWDDKIYSWYGKSPTWTGWVKQVYAHVRLPGTQDCLIAGRAHLGKELSVLRLWDMLLWQLRKDPASRALTANV
jgi:hypothetical protein